jgi:hypothetical protein
MIDTPASAGDDPKPLERSRRKANATAQTRRPHGTRTGADATRANVPKSRSNWVMNWRSERSPEDSLCIAYANSDRIRLPSLG